MLEVKQLIEESQRPVLWLGHGIRLAAGLDLLDPMLDYLGIPAIVSWAGLDMTDSKWVFGRAGVYGQRCANRIVQNADLIIAIGTRLSLFQTGYDLAKLPAKLVVCDIDPIEANKHRPALAVVEDARTFMSDLLGGPDAVGGCRSDWIVQCNEWEDHYPWVTTEDSTYIDPYSFMQELNEWLPSDAIVVTDMGTALICAHQVLRLKPPQRLLTSLGLGEMGFGLPAAVGAAIGTGRPVVCLNCDGGMMMNLQELQTIAANRLPVKIVVFSNDGYAMIKGTQRNLFAGRYTGVSQATGLSLPNFGRLCGGFGHRTLLATENAIPAKQVNVPTGAHRDPLSSSFGGLTSAEGCEWLMEQDGPCLLDVVCDPEGSFLKLNPKVRADGSIESPSLGDL